MVPCGGATKSPHVLMHSGIGPAEHLRDHGIPIVLDRPGVGPSLQDHLGVAVAYRSKYIGPIAETSTYTQELLPEDTARPGTPRRATQPQATAPTMPRVTRVGASSTAYSRRARSAIFG